MFQHVCVMLCALAPLTDVIAAERDAEKILEEFAEDYAFDPTARDIEIGFDISGERFFLTVDARDKKPHAVSLVKGFPDYPIAYWQMDFTTLRRLDAGMTGETATARARPDDPRLMVLRLMEGFPRYLMRRNGEFTNYLNSFKIHFFIKGTPEIVPIGREHAVISHGSGAVGLAYAPRMSSFIVHISPGEISNEEEDLDTNPFDTLFVPIYGRARARIGGNDATLEQGQAMFIPADVEHVFWNDFNEPFAGVMIIYGPWLNEPQPERAYPWW